MSGARATVLIPARNEALDIVGCVQAVASQQDVDELEVILVDGCSDDDTVDRALSAADALGLDLRVLSNPRRTAATALNLGLGGGQHEVVVRVDARSLVGPNHVARCCELLADPRVGVVGGGQQSMARNGAGWAERSIARALGNRYTTGLARYRRGATAGATDTVWMGAFRRDDLERVGGWPEFPEQNQDYRLNQRLREAGYLVWFDPALTAGYLPRGDFRSLARQYYRFGLAKGTVWRRGERPSARHLLILSAPLVGGLVLLGVGRRWGPARVGLLLGVGACAIDHIGSDRPAGPQERVGAVCATAVVDGAWLAGVVAALVRR